MEDIRTKRIQELLKELKPFYHLKVTNVTGATGPSFMAVWDAKLTNHLSIEEAYKLNSIQFLRGVTLFLEDGTKILTRIDIELPIIVYPK